MSDTYLQSLLQNLIDEVRINDTLQDPCHEDNSSSLCQDDKMLLNYAEFGNGTRFRNSHGLAFFKYTTPLIFIVGVVGNVLSLLVFLTKNMRKLSASVYLAALSTSDLLALVFYVLIEWIRHGLRQEFGSSFASFIDINGFCQFILFMTLLARFLSTWLVACFTLERYIGICHPLKRRDICDVNTSKKIIIGLIVTSVCVSCFRPFLNEVHHIGPNLVPWCIRNPNHVTISFIYDCVFAVCITFVPFLMITSLNILIIRTLIQRNRRHRKTNVITEESIIRFEFTVILITISFCFIAFNSPYAVVWLIHSLQASKKSVAFGVVIDNSQNLYYFTKTIFFMNYCINFFLYSITGAYFRKELRTLLIYKRKKKEEYHRCSVHISHQSTTTPNSWI